MQIPDVRIETERLVLRPPCGGDFESWVALMADPQQARYIGGVQPRAMVWRGMMAMVGAWAVHGFAMFSVIEKASGRWIGRIGPWCPEGWPGTEVGWALLADAGGRGYAQEAATAAIDWAFDHLGWTEVIHTIAPDNAPSIALARRLGSRYQRSGCFLPEPYSTTEVQVWGQSREEWQARRNAGGIA